MNRKNIRANIARVIKFLTKRFRPYFMKRYIKVPVAAIRTTNMLAFRVTPPVVSGKIVIVSIGAFDTRREYVNKPASAMAKISGSSCSGLALNSLLNLHHQL